MNVDNKVNYGLLTPKMFNRLVAYYLYFMHLSTIF
jgi:hypothetical protein